MTFLPVEGSTGPIFDLKLDLREVQRVLDALLSFAALFDLDGRLWLANEATLRVGGFGRDQLLGRRLGEAPWFSHDPSIAMRMTEAVAAAARGESSRFETRALTAQGEYLDVDVAFELLRDDQGNGLAVLASATDITDLRRKAALLAESETLFRALFEQASDAICLFDPVSHQVVLFNSKAADVLGYTHEEFARLGIGDIDAIESRTETRLRVDRIQRVGFSTFETIHRRKDGTLRDVEVRTSLVVAGGRELILAVWVDISERLAAARRLEESEALFRGLFEQSSDLLCVWDPATLRPVLFNRVAHESLGYNEAEFRALTAYEIEAPESSVTIPARIERLRSEGRVACNVTIRSKLGARFHGEVRAWPIMLEGREHYFSVWVDRSARVEEERFRLQRTREVELVLRRACLGEMAAMVAHELNQPLQAIALEAEALGYELGDLDGEGGHPGVQAIRAAVLRAGDLIRRIRGLVVAHTHDAVSTGLFCVVRNALAMNEVFARQHGVCVEAELDPQVPRVAGVAVELEQVCLNLLNNAVEAAAGSTDARCRVILRRGSPDKVEIVFEDSGPGASPEIETQLFEPFVSAKPGGMGMGLRISRQIVTMHGGTIEFQNRSAEQPTTVVVTLPALAEEEAP